MEGLGKENKVKMKNEIRKAVPLSTQLEDQIFNLHDKAWELLENESISLAKEKVMEAWNLLPEPKYNTACTGMTLRAMHEILTKSKDYDELENFFTQWTNDIENCGYQIINFEAFILLAEIYLFKNQIDKAKEIFAKTKKYKAPKRAFAEKPAFYFDIAQGKISDNDEIRRLFQESQKDNKFNADFQEITEKISEKIDALSEEGNELFDEEKFAEAIAVWEKALSLVPEPQQFYSESNWLETSIGDAYFALNDFNTALTHFENAKGNIAESGYDNPFVCLRLGQCYWETQDFANAKEFLLRAYMFEGEEIFEDENPKYFAFLKENVDLGGG